MCCFRKCYCHKQNKIDELCKIDLNAEKEAFKFNEEVSQKERMLWQYRLKTRKQSRKK